MLEPQIGCMSAVTRCTDLFTHILIAYRTSTQTSTQLLHCCFAVFPALPGKVKEARQLCVQAGQGWRCVSLAGGGPWGPLPVGLAAVAATDVVDAQVGLGDSTLAFVQLQMSAAHCMHGWQHTCLFSCIGCPGGMEPCGAACVMQQCIDAQQT